MTYRIAKALQVLRAEYDRKHPGRDRSSDGLLGDATHRRGWESSDHNPWVRDSRGVGVVRAADLDAGPGIDPNETQDRPGDELLVALLRAGKAGHPALGTGSYIIFERHIYRHAIRFRQERYWGTNPHNSHVHVSVGRDPASYDSTRSWGVSPAATPTVRPAAPTAPPITQLRYGASNSGVRALQERLKAVGLNPGVVDGIYGNQTRAAVREFQLRQGWSGPDADGLIGPVTLQRLF